MTHAKWRQRSKTKRSMPQALAALRGIAWHASRAFEYRFFIPFAIGHQRRLRPMYLIDFVLLQSAKPLNKLGQPNMKLQRLARAGWALMIALYVRLRLRWLRLAMLFGATSDDNR